MSLIPLYDDQPLFDDIYKILKESGFSYRGNISQMLNPLNDQVVQMDAIFVKDFQ
jgi:hypothetical protein